MWNNFVKAVAVEFTLYLGRPLSGTRAKPGAALQTASWFIHSVSQWVSLVNCPLSTVHCSGFKEAENQEMVVLDPKLIAREYIKSWFLLDLVSSIPVDYIFLVLDSGIFKTTTVSARDDRISEKGSIRILNILEKLKHSWTNMPIYLKN